MGDTETTILDELGLVGWRHLPDGRFKRVGSGKSPEWWRRICPAKDDDFHPQALDSDFVNNFLIDAEEIWNATRDGKIESGIWECQPAAGGYLLIQIHAVKSGEARLLVFQDLDATDGLWRNFLQSGRQNQLNLLRDISQRKQLELELRRAKENAERLEQAKMEFYAKTNHEIRTPLTSILAMTELALETQLDAAQREYLEATRRSAETLLRIMNDVLDFSKIEHGSLSIDATEFSLRELLADMERDFGRAAEERGIAFQTEFSGNNDLLFTDAVRLRQVLNNLVHNALRFTDEGGVTVTAKLSGLEPNAQSDRVRFEVADTGCGIPADQQERIFESFVQGDKGAGLQRGGTGLGLSIASKLVQLMKGDQLQLTSEPGVGTTFFFTIPTRLGTGSAEALPVSTHSDDTRAGFKRGLTLSGEMAISARNESPPKGQTPFETGSDLSVLNGLTIMVAEDNPVNRSYARHVLSKAGVQVVEAENGEQAVALFLQQQPDLVLMDCRMPVCDGIEATRRIRSEQRHDGTHVPIIAVTAHAMEQDVERCLAAGMDDYVSKPFKKQDLLNKLAKLASRS